MVAIPDALVEYSRIMLVGGSRAVKNNKDSSVHDCRSVYLYNLLFVELSVMNSKSPTYNYS